MAPSSATPFSSSAHEQSRFAFFHVLALSSCAFSLASIIFLAISIPMLYVQMEEDRTMIATKSQQFRVISHMNGFDEIRTFTGKFQSNLAGHFGKEDRGRKQTA